MQSDDGHWYLAYTTQDLEAVRVVTFGDGVTGLTDSEVYHGNSRLSWLSNPGIVVAPDHAIWVWWAEVDPDGAGFGNKAAWVARSFDGGESWSSPEEIAHGYYMAHFWAIDDWLVRAVVGGVGAGGRLISFSQDNGITWSEPHDLSLGGDGMQAVEIAVDSAGLWHFVVQTASTFATAAWDGRMWTSVDFIVPRETLVACCERTGEVTENAVGAISEGNHLHVFFEQDNRVIWYSQRRIDAPFVPSEEVKQAEPLADKPAATAVVVNSVEPDAAPTADTSVKISTQFAASNQPSRQLASVLFAVLPTSLLVSSYAISYLVRRRRGQ